MYQLIAFDISIVYLRCNLSSHLAFFYIDAAALGLEGAVCNRTSRSLIERAIQQVLHLTLGCDVSFVYVERIVRVNTSHISRCHPHHP